MSAWGFAAVFVAGLAFGAYAAVCWATGDGR
jgi:hypothetical protein